MGRVVEPSLKKVIKTSQKPMRSYIVKEKISVERLATSFGADRHTHRQPVTFI